MSLLLSDSDLRFTPAGSCPPHARAATVQWLVASYYWNTETDTLDSTTQWPLLPVFGIEWAF